MEAIIGTADPDLTRIIASAVAGDDIAFGRIVAAHEAEMHRICVASVPRPDHRRRCRPGGLGYRLAQARLNS